MKERITPYTIANTVRLVRTQRPHCVVIAEGAVDARIFKRFIDPSFCMLEIAHGKDNALRALALLKQDNVAGVMTLVDKDCVLLEPMLAANPDVLFTDSHDLETMMLQSPALEKVLSEFASDEKIQALADATGKSVREVLLEAALPIGLLRLASRRHNLDLKVEGCDYGSVINKDTVTVSIGALVKEILNKTRNHTLQRAVLEQLIEQERTLGWDIWDVCCGHDVSSVLSIGLRKLIGSCNTNDVSAISIERGLRLAYEESFFKATQLYRALKEWEARNVPFRILL